MSTKLNITIVNYRTPKLVIDCLASLAEEVAGRDYLVVVVDNASGDDSVAQIERAIAKHNWDFVRVVASSVNGGFSAGNNLGINSAIADAYLLLNSDTIVRPGAISTLLQALAEPKVGMVSPRLEWLDGTPQISCFSYRSPVSELIRAAATSPISKSLKKYDVPIPVADEPSNPPWTSFACVLIRHEVIAQIGLMDEGYFMYFDDLDYCRKARNAGWEILHLPQARVVHLRGGSSSVKADVAARKRPKQYYYASRSRYFATFYGDSGLTIANLFWLTGRSISALRELLGNKQPHTCEGEAQDIWHNWRSPMKPFLPTDNKS